DALAGLVRELITIALTKSGIIGEDAAKGFEKSKALFDVFLIYKAAQEEAIKLYLTLPAFALGMSIGLAWGLKALYKDPDLPGASFDAGSAAIPQGNFAGAQVKESASMIAGQTTGTITTASGQVTGSIQAIWSTTQSTSSFLATGLQSANAQVMDGRGQPV